MASIQHHIRCMYILCISGLEYHINEVAAMQYEGERVQRVSEIASAI